MRAVTFGFRRKLRKTSGASALLPVDSEKDYKPIEWPLLRRMLTMLAPYKRSYLIGLGLGVVIVFLEMLGPQFMQRIINFTTDYTTGALATRPSESQAIWRVASIIGTWALVFYVAVILQRFSILVLYNAGERVQFDLRRAIFAQLQRLSMSYYDKTKLGRIICRCTSDLTALRDVNVSGINTIVLNTLMMIVAAGMLWYTDWRLFLSVAWLGPVLFLMNYIYRKKFGYMYQVVREGWTRVSTNLAENITGMRVVMAFNRQEPNLETFNDLQIANTDNNVMLSRINGAYQPLLNLVGFVGKVIILTFGGYLVVTGHIGQEKGVGAVVAAFLYWDWFMNPILTFGTFYNQLMVAMAGAERLFNLLDTKPEVQDVPAAVPFPRIRGDVEFDHVTFGYNPERPVLHDVCFKATPGQMIALVGATGSGKSSIISLIARFYQPQQGRILVDSQDIRYAVGETLNRQTGLVLQVNYLFTGTVIENIRYPRPDATEQEVMEAAKAIGSHDVIMSLNNGYHTEVGERGASMSLGQRQLICFTRAFLADPRIFMLDEATSAIDTATEVLVQRSLEKLLEGRTTFIVAHRLSTIMRADCILVIDHGRIVERGTHSELVDAGGKYSHLYEQFVQHSE